MNNISLRPNFNQPINQKTTFKAKPQMVKEAVDLMGSVRCSYNNFEANTIKRVVTNMRNKLNAIIKHEQNSGDKIFIESDVMAIEKKIESMEKLAEKKLSATA